MIKHIAGKLGQCRDTYLVTTSVAK